MIGYIFLGVVVAFVVFMIIKNTKSVMKMNGKLVSKSSNMYSQTTPTRFGSKASNYTEYVFTFELENNKIELLVDKKVYDQYFVNDYGLVSYKGNKLINFEKCSVFKRHFFSELF